MKNLFSQSRRDFIKLSATTAISSMPLFGLANELVKSELHVSRDLKIFIFSKHLRFLDYPSMCEAAKEMGFDGIDLTVRPKGHVLPENVSEHLPLATEAMKNYGLDPHLVTTKITDAKSPMDRKVLEMVGRLGYKYYRTGWFKYSDKKNLQQSAQVYENKIKALALLNNELGISGSYHNHSGHYFGSSIWELKYALMGLSPEHLGSQYDIMHATVEGGKNWPIGLNLISKHINTLVIKDFKWGRVGGIWKPIFTPLGEGMIDFKKYFSLLKKYNINVPISVHCEYDLGGAEHGGAPSIDRKEVFGKIRKDLLFIRNAWINAE